MYIFWKVKKLIEGGIYDEIIDIRHLHEDWNRRERLDVYIAH